MNGNFKLISISMLSGIAFTFLAMPLHAVTDIKSVKSLDMIVSDDYLPSENRFSHHFLCTGDNRVIIFEGRNYKSKNDKFGAEITRIQSNATQVEPADLEAINSRILNIGGYKISMSHLRCNTHQVKLILVVRKKIEGKHSDGMVELTVSNDASIKITDY
jgi:hypothetical protein